MSAKGNNVESAIRGIRLSKGQPYTETEQHKDTLSEQDANSAEALEETTQSESESYSPESVEEGGEEDMEKDKEYYSILKAVELHKQEREAKRRANTISFELTKFWFFILIFAALVFGFVAGSMYTQVKLYEDVINPIEASFDETLDTAVSSVKNQLADTEWKLALSETISKGTYNLYKTTYDKLGSDSLELSALKNTLTLYMQRAELHDKFEYALFDSQGNRTDLTYDQLQFGINEMKEKNIDPNLLLGTIKIESGFRETIQNSASSATGYGQMLKGTGEWVYETLMKRDNYSHSMAKDGYTNIEMTAEYLAYLLKRNDGDVLDSLIAYNGNELGVAYYNMIDRTLRTANGYGLETIQTQYKSSTQ